MSDLITKEELLELGFITFQDDDWMFHARYSVITIEEISVITNIDVNFDSENETNTISWMADGCDMVFELESTKHNVMKLIGELE